MVVKTKVKKKNDYLNTQYFVQYECNSFFFKLILIQKLN